MDQSCCRTESPVRTGLPEVSEDSLRDTASLLRALADPVRLRVFLRIAATDEVCVCDLDDVGVSQPTVSHHLKKLREAGLIASQRRGTWVYYRLTGSGVVVCRALDILVVADRAAEIV